MSKEAELTFSEVQDTDGLIVALEAADIAADYAPVYIIDSEGKPLESVSVDCVTLMDGSKVYNVVFKF